MEIHRTTQPRRGFTLIEMMVVVAIIGLLLAALLPAFGTVRQKARYAQASAIFKGLDTGIISYQTESALGGSLPPSSSDNPTNRQIIVNPKSKSGGSTEVRVSGAHLIAMAMVGSDGLGTAGFKDADRDGRWWNDVHNDVNGLYELDPTTFATKRTRYGSAGFVDDKIRSRMKSLTELEDGGVVLNLSSVTADIAKNEPMFLDPWDSPILYFRANRSAFRPVHAQGKPGVFRQEDNGIITGTENGAAGASSDMGIDFGAGKVNSKYHELIDAKSPQVTDTIDDILNTPSFDHTFARFILDPTIKSRPTPVQKESYLLISAGPDSRYGTDDDVINWEKRGQE